MRIFPDIVPERYQNGSGIDWPKEVLEGLSALDEVLDEARERRNEYLVVQARLLGLAAERLEDLSSERGAAFSETTNRGYRSLHQAAEDIDPSDRKARYDREWAYYCGYQDLLDGKMTAKCGWVKGYPRSESYDNIGCLAGSAGMHYYCQICGAMIGEREDVVS